MFSVSRRQQLNEAAIADVWNDSDSFQTIHQNLKADRGAASNPLDLLFDFTFDKMFSGTFSADIPASFRNLFRTAFFQSAVSKRNRLPLERTDS